MKNHVASMVLIILSIGLFAVAQETVNNRSSAAAPSGGASLPQLTYKTVKTAAPYGTANYVPLWTGLNTVANSALYQSGLNVGIGTTSPAATLDVNGTINAAAGFNLGGTSFAFGSYTNRNSFLGFAGNSTTTGIFNTASGYQALAANTSGNQDTANGSWALTSNTTGYANAAIGTGALYSNTTGSDDTASGNGALYHNTTGSDNTASGNAALFSNTTASYNTAAGFFALFTNTTGYFNTASGYEALYSNATGNSNTADGVSVLYNNTTGGDNTASGFGALNSNTTGNYNTAVGVGALSTNTTGSDLTCIGYECTASADGLFNATAIGAHAAVAQSNALVLGGTGAYAVRVGIGTATPSNILTIAPGAGHPLSDGWTTYSSRRWKTNIHTLHDALAKVGQLRGVSYDLKANGQHEVGVIAEEVGAVVPEVVTWEENGEDAQSVDYGRLTALLIEATKEQQALIHAQQQQIQAQQAQMKVQQAQLVRLTRQVRTIQVTLKAGKRSGPAVRTAKADALAVRQ